MEYFRPNTQDSGERWAIAGGGTFTAFRLIESGVEAKPGIESLLHILQLASKTGATLSEIGRHDVAARVLTSAAKYEELLRNTDDPDGVHQTAIACGTVVYFSSRMEAAWQEKNYTVADFMSQKITDDDQRLTLLPLHSRQLLASKFHRIGKSALELPEGTKPSDAVVWLQKAFTLADPLEDNGALGVAELKISILQTLAKAYFVAGSYDRAEATLEELIPSIDASPDHVRSMQVPAIDEDHARALKTVDTVFTSLCQAEVELDTVPTTACLTLLWQYGDRHYHAKKWLEAADWYLAGSHKLFRLNSPTTSTKCFRKAALCYIEQREFARASTVIRRCPTNEAKTHYVIFTIAIHQGLEDEAVRAVREMVEAPDFDRNMLLLATQLSHQSEMKGVLLSVLEALLKTLKLSNSGETAVEAMTLIRCIIRLAVGLLGDPTVNRTTLIDTVVNHFRTARILTEAACTQKAMSLISKDVSWLWRTAYNCAVQGCSEWERCEERVADLFDIARGLLEALCQASPVEMDSEVYSHLANASFSAFICYVEFHVLTNQDATVFSTRETILASTGKAEQISAVTAEIVACKKRILSIMEKEIVQKDEEVLRMQYFIHTLQVFEAEFLTRAKLWEQIPPLVQEIVSSGPLALGTYEAIADILRFVLPIRHPGFLTPGSPTKTLLRASLDHNHLSVEKFSRWLRAICTIILARNTPEDRAKAIGYVEQALTVIEDNLDSDQPYPIDERQWLLATTYNTGTECLHGAMLDEAKRWFEASTLICRFVPGGQDRAEKISDTYTHLLSRYGSK
ncbi:hypothetical protein C0995_001042 [Termitomyces sp. Mi166|nr:hypothetical protein C0995_001042 [Termitomyces sp. Mi166\